jgi:hypothetical protein
VTSRKQSRALSAKDLALRHQYIELLSRHEQEVRRHRRVMFGGRFD